MKRFRRLAYMVSCFYFENGAVEGLRVLLRGLRQGGVRKVVEQVNAYDIEASRKMVRYVPLNIPKLRWPISEKVRRGLYSVTLLYLDVGVKGSVRLVLSTLRTSGIRGVVGHTRGYHKNKLKNVDKAYRSKLAFGSQDQHSYSKTALEEPTQVDNVNPQSGGLVLDSNYSIETSKFDEWLANRCDVVLSEGVPLRAKKKHVLVVISAARTVTDVSTDSSSDIGLTKTLDSLCVAAENSEVDVTPIFFGLSHTNVQATTRVLKPTQVCGIEELKKEIGEAELDDVVMFLRPGDVVHPQLFKIMQATGAVDCDLAVIDMSISEEGQTHPLFLPGVNFIHALNCDYFRSRFFAKLEPVLEKLRVGKAFSPRDIAVSILRDARRLEMHQRVQHVAIPLLKIAEPIGALKDEREALSERRKVAQYGGSSQNEIDQRSASIIICTKDNGFLVNQLVEALLKDYPKKVREIIIVSNQTSNLYAVRILKQLASHPAVTIVDYDQPFNFSAQCNVGAKSATGDILIFMNDDIVPVNSAWLDEIMEPFDNEEVGIVAPLLLYPDQRVQHCGMFLGYNGVAGHELRFAQLPQDEYMFLASSPRETIAVTGAVMAVPRTVFDDLNGFDVQFVTYIQDVDLCLRVHYSGKRVVLNPRSILIHMESISVKTILTDSKVMESRGAQYERFKNKWGEHLHRDPYHNSNQSIDDESMKTLASSIGDVS
tara:strand:- start:10573 stop:12705 length:2133 start_codon:yes stop_codon:yes gene_type:complete